MFLDTAEEEVETSIISAQKFRRIKSRKKVGRRRKLCWLLLRKIQDEVGKIFEGIY
jgi:hypothetical protein